MVRKRWFNQKKIKCIQGLHLCSKGNFSRGFENLVYKTNKTRGLQLCPGFHFTTLWISNPRNGQNMTIFFYKYCVLFDNKTRGLQLCPGFHFTTQWISNPRNGQNMTLLWPKHGPHMVPQIGSSWLIINVPRDAPCQISQFWVYPIVPFSYKWPKYGPFMGKTWSFKLVPPESLINMP